MNIITVLFFKIYYTHYVCLLFLPIGQVRINLPVFLLRLKCDIVNIVNSILTQPRLNRYGRVAFFI